MIQEEKQKSEIQEIKDILERTLIATRDSTSPSLSKIILDFQSEFKLFKQEVFNELKNISKENIANRNRIVCLEEWKEKRIIELAEQRGGIRFTVKTASLVAIIFGGVAGTVTWVLDTYAKLVK